MGIDFFSFVNSDIQLVFKDSFFNMKFFDNFPSWSIMSLMNIIPSFIQFKYIIISDLFLNLICWFPHIISYLIVLKLLGILVYLFMDIHDFNRLNWPRTNQNSTCHENIRYIHLFIKSGLHTHTHTHPPTRTRTHTYTHITLIINNQYMHLMCTRCIKNFLKILGHTYALYYFRCWMLMS